jgi:hypothetical protein
LLEAGFDKLLIARSRLQEEHPSTEFSYSKFKENWIYQYTLCETGSVLPKVVALNIAIMGKTFNPERYARLTELLAKVYSISGSPPKVLEAYLGAYTKDAFNFGANWKYNANEFDDRKALVKCSLKCMHYIANFSSTTFRPFHSIPLISFPV